MSDSQNYSYRHANSVVNQRRRRRYLRYLYLNRPYNMRNHEAIFLSMLSRLPRQSSNDPYVNDFFNGFSFS
jgi:hypothetical protein